MRLRDLRLDMFTNRGGDRCVRVARHLQAYLDDQLGEPDRERIAGHLAVCRRCGLDEQTFRQIKHALADTGTQLPSEPVDRLRTFAATLANDEPGRA